MKAYSRDGGEAPRILDLSARWRNVFGNSALLGTRCGLGRCELGGVEGRLRSLSKLTCSSLDWTVSIRSAFDAAARPAVRLTKPHSQWALGALYLVCTAAGVWSWPPYIPEVNNMSSWLGCLPFSVCVCLYVSDITFSSPSGNRIPAFLVGNYSLY
jgi:hypothetical protein